MRKIVAIVMLGRIFRPSILMGFLLICTLLPARASHAQWEYVTQLPSTIDVFTSLGDSILYSGGNKGLWQSTDTGQTWTKVSSFKGVFDIYFRSKEHGWIGAESANLDSLIETTDAGVTWKGIAGMPAGSNGIFENPSTHTLYLARGGQFANLLLSRDTGITWNEVPYAHVNGAAFGKDSVVVFGAGIPYQLNNLRSSDDGRSWGLSPTQDETYQPVGVPQTDTIVLVSELGAQTTPPGSRTTDGGKSWVSLSPGPAFLRTGQAIWCDCGSAIVTQSFRTDDQGVLYSTDLGDTWTQLGGPSNNLDSRSLRYTGRYIYAGNGAFGRVGEIWRYKLTHRPKISLLSTVHGCSRIDTALQVSFVNVCFGIPARLDTMSIAGSDAWAIDSIALPHQLQPIDQIKLHYTPTYGRSDTSYLYLKFDQNGDVKDTTIMLIGIGADPPNTVALRSVPSRVKVLVGDTVTFRVYPNKSIAAAGVHELRFDLSFLQDVIDVLKIELPYVVTADVPSVKNGLLTTTYTLSASDVAIDSAVSLLTVRARTTLTDTCKTEITVSNVALNPAEPSYSACVLSASGSSATLIVDLSCGDSLLVKQIRSEPIEILSIHPNPATSELTILLDKLAAGTVHLEIWDALGRRRVEREITSAQSTIDISRLPSGPYLLRVSESGTVRTRRFVVDR